MLKKTAFILSFLSLGLYAQTVSGKVENGIRILDWNPDQTHYVVYRGDYIKFRIKGPRVPHIVRIPALKVNRQIEGNPDHDKLIKMELLGNLSMLMDNQPGTLEVIGLSKPNYKEINATDALELIDKTHLFILDVRTPREYAAGHLQGAKLIPVQVLQTSLAQLDSVKDEEILVYCHSGNRSTVASKILLDNGFKRIYNMQGGITSWRANGLPVEK